MNPQLSNAPAGPGAHEEQGENPKPLLEGSSSHEYVTILNPLSVDFIGMVGVSGKADVPFRISSPTTATRSESDIARNYGLELKNPSHTGRANVTNRVRIPSGQTIHLTGNEAQVVVRQLVTEILAREGKKLHLADPTARREVEERVVLSRRSVDDLLGHGPVSVDAQLAQAVNDLNTPQEHQIEPEFPTLSQRPTGPDQPVVPTAPAEPTNPAPAINWRSREARAARAKAAKSGK